MGRGSLEISKILVDKLGSLDGRKALERVFDLLGTPVEVESTALNGDIPIDRIVWIADHRINTNNLSEARVRLGRVEIQGLPIYFVHDGHHRVELAFESGKNTIPSVVSNFQLSPARLRFRSGYQLLPSKCSIPHWVAIEDDVAILLTNLGLVTVEKCEHD